MVYSDPRHAIYLGDMPHTWIGSEYARAIFGMLMHEGDDTLSLLPGTPLRFVTISVDPANTHTISPWIYGMNFYQDSAASIRNLTINRMGGNLISGDEVLAKVRDIAKKR